MRPETNVFISDLSRKYTFPEPIVDLGGCETNRQFKDIFSHYEVWDRRRGSDVDRSIDITAPLPTDTFGYASSLICVDTLEHIWEFQLAIKNMGSLVKQNGLIVLAMPFAFPYHDTSGDWWRFTHQALERLFSEDFFKKESGYYGDKMVATSEMTGQIWGDVNTTVYYVGTRK